MPISSRRTGSVNAIRMVTGGDSYSSTPTVTFTGGGGTGAAGVVCMAGTHVERIVITNAGTGYTSDPIITFSSGEARAIAYAHTSPLRPMTFVRSRFNDVYGVDGMGRGVRWDGDTDTMEPIGLQKPVVKPTVVVSGTSNSQRLVAVNIENPGTGYVDRPVVTVSGGNPTENAELESRIGDGEVRRIDIKNRGRGFTSNPTITLTGGQGGGATLGVGVDGKVSSVLITNQGSGYTTAPTVTFSGIADATATATVADGKVTSITLDTPGSGATGLITATLTGGGGSNATVAVESLYKVTSVTAVNAGSGYFFTPQVVFNRHPEDTTATAAIATATTDGNGAIQTISLTSDGEYSLPPTAEILGTTATASAVLSRTLVGKYRCYIRYIDDTDVSERGPICSSISEVTEVNCGPGAGELTWSFSHPYLDDRVAGMQLWRTTRDQSIVLFKVVEIARTDAAFNGTYVDTIDDGSLKDPERLGFGAMPINMPSGQINARRFAIPPGNFSVAVMFQDRMWMAVDTTGEKPNTLVYSEVDEPESVPGANRLVLQESITDSDKIIGLIPLGTVLVAAQQRHLYTITYVAQPVIDAAIQLGCYRGMLNSRCYGILNGVAYIADSAGIYGFDGSSEEPVSVPIDDLWRGSEIDFTKSEKFFVKTDTSTRTLRFFYCNSTDTHPQRALCYCIATKAWWKEEYSEVVASGTNTMDGGKLSNIYGGQAGRLNEPSGYTDNGTDISYSVKTGNLPLSNEDDGSRAIGVTYTPTDAESNLNVKLHYNNSATSRPNAIQTRPGTGFEASTEGAVLNMKKARSALGDATGTARAKYSGRVDEKSSGGDKHIAVAFSGTQSAANNSPTIHSVSIEGAE